MGHNWNCPDPWTARREAEWDARDGYNRRRYEGECDEAAREYAREYRYQEERLEEERSARRRAEYQRQQHAYEEQQYIEYAEAEEAYRQQEEEHYAALEAEYFDRLCDEARQDFFELPRMDDDGNPNHSPGPEERKA